MCARASTVQSLLTWRQLEVLVCGKADVDVDLLESVTDYSSCAPSDTHIRHFWQVMREFSTEERSALLRFTWGRSRLPLTASAFPQRFRLQSFNKRPADAYYPVAHTCFFSLELPHYSSLELMREKLRYAIFNCEAIDGDDTSSGDAIAALGWEE
jgi:E3 ubiquitin-protein ligase HERC2